MGLGTEGAGRGGGGIRASTRVKGYKRFRRFSNPAHLPQSVPDQSRQSRSLHVFPDPASLSIPEERCSGKAREMLSSPLWLLKYFPLHSELLRI